MPLPGLLGGLILLVDAVTWEATQVVLVGKNLPVNAGDVRDSSLIPGLGRSPGGGNSIPLQYSCLENPMDKEPGGLQSIGLQRFGHD